MAAVGSRHCVICSIKCVSFVVYKISMKNLVNQRRCRNASKPSAVGSCRPPSECGPSCEVRPLSYPKWQSMAFHYLVIAVKSMRPKSSELECSQASSSCKISHPERRVQSTGTINNRVLLCPSVVPHVKFGEDPT